MFGSNVCGRQIFKYVSAVTKKMGLKCNSAPYFLITNPSFVFRKNIPRICQKMKYDLKFFNLNFYLYIWQYALKNP